MFENKEKTPLDQIGEFKLINHLTEPFKTTHKSTIIGIGDDAAVLNTDKHIVMSSDLMVEGTHFDLMYTPLKHLGYKAVVVNMSDILAMNAKPSHMMVSMAISSKYTLEAVEELYAGILTACEKYNIDLIGGDTSSSPKGLFISITMVGQIDDPKNLVTRAGAKEGDLICVSGDLGGAYAGLQMLEREKRVFLEQPEMQPDLEGYDYVIGRQLRPEARVDLIELLDELEIVPTSMIDVSDGIASETFHICKASKVGAKIYEEKIPIDTTTYNTARDLHMDPTLYALNGGEDYELLFTLKQAEYDKIKNSLDISIIGYCCEEHEGLSMISKSGNVHELQAQGWNAFGDQPTDTAE
ncbi:MAG: thiamine-phosphate kinase [Bacteroidia bacterium]